jgi:hypothetical protein
MLSISLVSLYRRNVFSARHAVVAGVVWGISILFASLLLAIFAASLLLSLVFAWREDRLGGLRFCLIECLTVAVCLAPWAIRNYCELGAPILTRSNLGLELRVSNNDVATADEHSNVIRGVYRTYHPFESRKEALKLCQLGEVEYNRRAEEQALNWIRQHRKRFIRLTVQRARLFWFYKNPSLPLRQRIKFGCLALIHLLAFLGLISLFRRNSKTALVLLVILAVYPIPNYFIHVGPRQSYPVDWILVLLMSTALIQLGTATFRRTDYSERRPHSAQMNSLR